jgi:hypothetical protein
LQTKEDLDNESVRTGLRTYQEGMLRVLTADPRISDKDAARIKEITGDATAWFTSPATAKRRIETLTELNLNRIDRNIGALNQPGMEGGIRKNSSALAAAIANDQIDRKLANFILDKYYGDSDTK